MKAASLALFAGMMGCAFAHPLAPAQAARFKESVIYSFGGSGGSEPFAGLIDVNGALDGTACCGAGFGTVFSIDPSSDAETVLHTFGEVPDAQTPFAGLIDVTGTLYGTTEDGGASGHGAIFSVDPSTGSETVLYSFKGADGEYPRASLINVGGTLYGTTSGGGTDSWGVVFAFDPATGTETVVHSFVGNNTDGRIPYGGLTSLNGMLYGTTTGGGMYADGTVFAVDPTTGAETVLHAFCIDRQSCHDGALPEAGLVDVSGTLYGTTYSGGNATSFGSVFAIDPSTGNETLVHSFEGQEGAKPAAALIDVKGMLYGTATSGGTHGKGTVFALDPKTGAVSALYSFCSRKTCADGSQPQAALTYVKGTFYGTTETGGSHGAGTVFALKP